MDINLKYQILNDLESENVELIIYPKERCNDMYVDGGIGIELSKEECFALMGLMLDNICDDKVEASETKEQKTKDTHLPLPQRYIDKQDGATLKTIELIGRENLKKLLDNNIIIQDYDTYKINQKSRLEKKEGFFKALFGKSNN